MTQAEKNKLLSQVDALINILNSMYFTTNHTYGKNETANKLFKANKERMRILKMKVTN